MAGTWNLGFSDIYGAGMGQTGGAQNIMSYIAKALGEAEKEGFTDYDWMGSSSFGGLGAERGYGISDWQDFLGSETYQEGGASTEEEKGMAGTLSDVLTSLDIEGMTKEYKQSAGDIETEISAKMQGLQKGLGTKGKSSRYGGLGATKKPTGGGARKAYMADIYGLQQQQAEMQESLQEGMEEDFYNRMGNWMSMHPTVE